MAAKVTHTESISLSEMTLIGKTGTSWGDWWANGWFDVLENHAVKPVDPDYLGAMHGDAYWVGLLFPAGTIAPEGYESLEIPAADYALNYLYGKEDGADMYGPDALRLCTQAMEAQGLHQAPGVVMERYNCPRFTTPDAEGNVIIDYLIPVK